MYVLRRQQEKEEREKDKEVCGRRQRMIFLKTKRRKQQPKTEQNTAY